MKTVSGRIVSCKPVSLSKAAKILSKFELSDNGVSPAFAAYLKRTSASFNELVQLYKEFKGLGGEREVKKQHCGGIVTQETVASVKNPSQDGLLSKEKGISKMKKHERGNRDEGEAAGIEASLSIDKGTLNHYSMKSIDEGERRHNAEGIEVSMEAQISEGIVNEYGTCAVDARKKSKKKRETNEIMAITHKDQSYGDHDAVNANDVKNDSEIHDSKKETKKKKKRDKLEKEKHTGPVESEKEVQNHPGNQEDGNGAAAHKKKGTHEGEERDSEHKVEIEAANNKKSRKRKHEKVASRGLDASQEEDRPKKKKR